MQEYTIDIKPTTTPAIVKFDANRFLTRNESFEFKNIDEAERSPLAQQLFHLPFVKTVYIAQNFVAIEKYNIVEWDDVQQELAEQITNYLNSGSQAILPSKEQAKEKKIPVTVYAESTPNPSVMKFVSNRKLVLQIAEFKNIDEAKDAPLAKALFHFPFVKEVFIDENYLSITKFDIAEWEEITLELREFVKEYLEQGKEVVTENYSAQAENTYAPESRGEEDAQPKVYDSVSQEIIDILEEYVKPAVASDGGNIRFDSYDSESKKVKVILQGACSGCPSSTLTLKSGIETMLRDMMHGRVEHVEAVNG